MLECIHDRFHDISMTHTYMIIQHTVLICENICNTHILLFVGRDGRQNRGGREEGTVLERVIDEGGALI